MSRRLPARLRVGTYVTYLAAFAALAVTVVLVVVPDRVIRDAVAGYHRPIWSDDFSGPDGAAPDPDHWGNVVGGNGWGNDEIECYTDSRDNSDLDGHGHLVITARRVAGGHVCADGRTNPFTSARLDTQHKFEFKYGRVEIRAKVEGGLGTWPAFWALGSDDQGQKWPRSGEFDVLEDIGRQPERVSASLHAANAAGVHVAMSEPMLVPQSLAGPWHTYAVTWTPSRLSYAFDGVTFRTFTRAELAQQGAIWPFDHNFFLVLNLAMGGGFAGPVDPTIATSRFVVDWVRIYQT